MIAPEVQHRITYFKRYRMEIDLQEGLPCWDLPQGYFFVPWDEALLPLHAEVKFHCFIDEIDATVFPSLGSRQGCSRLMREIRQKPGFCPEATWLLATPSETCGTVQGVCDRTGLGAIQNLGITRSHRGKGLGKSLLLQSLAGFRRQGASRVFLEVTSQNDLAIRLYRNLGFRSRKTLYKAVDALAFLEPSSPDPGWFL